MIFLHCKGVAFMDIGLGTFVVVTDRSDMIRVLSYLSEYTVSHYVVDGKDSGDDIEAIADQWMETTTEEEVVIRFVPDLLNGRLVYHIEHRDYSEVSDGVNGRHYQLVNHLPISDLCNPNVEKDIRLMQYIINGDYTIINKIDHNPQLMRIIQTAITNPNITLECRSVDYQQLMTDGVNLAYIIHVTDHGNSRLTVTIRPIDNHLDRTSEQFDHCKREMLFDHFDRLLSTHTTYMHRRNVPPHLSDMENGIIQDIKSSVNTIISKHVDERTAEIIQQGDQLYDKYGKLFEWMDK